MIKRILSLICIATVLNIGVSKAQESATIDTITTSSDSVLLQDREVILDEMVKEYKKRQPLEVNFDVRADWQLNAPGIDGQKTETGFSGKFLNLIINGNINHQWAYHLRHRINKLNLTQDFFEATDFAYVTYQPHSQWELSAGKYVVGIGGFEYDAAPIDVYYYSIGGGNMPACYEFGVSGKFTTKKGNNSIFLQVTNSPFTSKSYRFEGLYAYNLMWYGNFNVFQTIYSVNMIEYAPNKYFNYIALGNKFNFGPVTWYIDYLNRYALKGHFFTDFSIISRLDCNIRNRASIFVKAGIDYNKSQSAETATEDIWDTVVLPGTNRVFYGAGVEFYPMKNSHDVRLHAYWSSSNENFREHNVGIGIRWLLHAYKH